MSRVLAVGLDEPTHDALAECAREVAGVAIEPAEAAGVLEERLAGADALVVGPAVSEPVRTAQRAFAIAPEVPVVIVVEPDRRAEVVRSLQFAPLVGGDVHCVAAPRQQLALERGQELASARRRRAYRDTVTALDAQLAPFSMEPTSAAARDLLGQLLDNAPVGVLLTDAAGVVRGHNRRAARILERSDRDMLGSCVAEHFPDDAERWHDLLRTLNAGAGAEAGAAASPAAGSWLFLRRPGSGERHIEVTAAPVRGRTGEEGVLLILDDVSERMRLMKELRDAVDARDEFLSIASHELKTPLTAIHLQVQVLARDSDLPPEITGRAAAIERSTRRLAELIDTLLDVSRIRAGRLELELEDVDLAAVARDVVERLGGAGSTVTVSGDAPVVGRWDRLRLEQVIANLVGNAIKYGAGRPVDVILQSSAAVARLRVVDRGAGIPLDRIGRIFDRFERAAPAKNFGGLGLGLWIVRRIVDAMSGSVAVESRVGEGSTFTVELPR